MFTDLTSADRPQAILRALAESLSTPKHANEDQTAFTLRLVKADALMAAAKSLDEFEVSRKVTFAALDNQALETVRVE